ncbi:ABC transporter ATP-binding protein [Methanospirillum hungatei]|uniref:ABC transporter ATP-binding protein n=1 Tax=Methanospirillum hungatei TaxID=2203 RepID=UPI0026F053DD|nr:ABC transporter ATP-binding protein [Methanospirillum hungatei]MCA1914839.1 ABC transporter ATP-binding protein [Methanospirillum hungatei]
MSEIVIKVENISKLYRLGIISHNTLYQDIQSKWARLRGAEDPNTPIDQLNSGFKSNECECFWALKNISFDVRKGEILGIIGRNGAGKSTLLKILSRVTAPTEGKIKIKGRIASLLEVGTGFHPELTGRENVFLNGAILGMTKQEISEKFDDIVAFAEVEKFIDTPVKRYSSGMYVRLAFAVAAHLEPEILIVDEVLAVGDARFQKKCIGKMGEVAGEGRTVLFVSHNMNAVKNLCGKVILLEAGNLVYEGDTHKGIAQYVNEDRIETTTLDEEYLNSIMTGLILERNPTVRFQQITISDINGTERATFRSDEEIKITMRYRCYTKVTNLRLLITVLDSEGNRIMNTLNYDDESVVSKNELNPGVFTSICTFPKNLFGENRFYLSFSMINDYAEHINIEKGMFFDILFYSMSSYLEKLYENTCIRPLLKWTTYVE